VSASRKAENPKKRKIAHAIPGIIEICMSQSLSAGEFDHYSQTRK
jgi:hypothetical protein